MSSSYVRQLVRQWATEASAYLSIPYYETVNTEADPRDPVWFTLEFESFAAETTTFCGEWEEQGAVDIVVLAQAGQGDGVAINAAEMIRDELMAKVDPANRIHWAGPAAPAEFSGGSGESRWYQVLMSLEYTFQN